MKHGSLEMSFKIGPQNTQNSRREEGQSEARCHLSDAALFWIRERRSRGYLLLRGVAAVIRYWGARCTRRYWLLGSGKAAVIAR